MATQQDGLEAFNSKSQALRRKMNRVGGQRDSSSEEEDDEDKGTAKYVKRAKKLLDSDSEDDGQKVCDCCYARLDG